LNYNTTTTQLQHKKKNKNTISNTIQHKQHKKKNTFVELTPLKEIKLMYIIPKSFNLLNKHTITSKNIITESMADETLRQDFTFFGIFETNLGWKKA